jgi:hypothetical protein
MYCNDLRLNKRLSMVILRCAYTAQTMKTNKSLEQFVYNLHCNKLFRHFYFLNLIIWINLFAFYPHIKKKQNNSNHEIVKHVFCCCKLCFISF